MQYADGLEVHLGDSVRLEGGVCGIVVCSLDNNEYSAAFPKSEWSYLGKGILVHSPSLGLIHYERQDPGLIFVARNGDAS